jgi:ribosomal protein S18 acetylase RimI-like enzyme
VIGGGSRHRNKAPDSEVHHELDQSNYCRSSKHQWSSFTAQNFAEWPVFFASDIWIYYSHNSVLDFILGFRSVEDVQFGEMAKVRPIEEADFVPVTQLFHQCECLINIGRSTQQPLITAFGEAYVKETLESGDLSSYEALCSVFRKPKCEFWVLHDETSHSVLGSVAIEFKDCETAELRRMCVAHKARRQGFGTALVRQCLKFAREQGYKQVILTTPVINIPAITMYEKAGFERNGADAEYTRADLGIFNLKLANLSCQL